MNRAFEESLEKKKIFLSPNAKEFIEKSREVLSRATKD